MSKTWKVMLLMILAVVVFSFLVFGVRTAQPSGFSLVAASAPGGSTRAGFPDDPPGGGAVVWYLGHCGYAVRTQNLDFFTKFRVRAAFPMHVQAGDAMYLNFQKTFQAKFPALTIQVPMKMGQKFIFADGKIVN